MKERLRELVQGAAEPGHALNLVREYLQARILGSIQRAGGMVALAFCGGTALRFLHRLPRFSEDLDFSLENKDRGFSLRAEIPALRSELEAEGYEVGLKLSDRRAVHSAFVRFPGLMYELGLSGRREQVLSVKLEIDTNPPPGARCETSVVRRHLTLQLQHHDRASLLAGKLHAVLQRPYTKGRDLHDLLWYLADPGWPQPNLTLLNNALRQTGWGGEKLTARSWAGVAEKKLREVDFDLAQKDVRPFLEPGVDPELITAANLRRLLKQRGP